MKEMIAFAKETQGSTKNVHAAVLASSFGNATLPGQDRMVEIVVNVAGDEEVEHAVPVVIAPSRASGPPPKSDTSLFGNIRERAVVIVVVEAVLAEI